MMEFMRAGGFGMWVVLLFSLAAVVSAVLFAVRPGPRRLQILRSLTSASVFSVLATVSANLAAVMSKVPNHPEWSKSPDIHLIIMTGLAESLTPAILGFTLLGITWFVVAVGFRRYEESGLPSAP